MIARVARLAFPGVSRRSYAERIGLVANFSPLSLNA